MALVTPVVPPTRRNVELALLLLAVAVAGAAYAIVGLTVNHEVPQDGGWYGGGLALLVARRARGAALARPLRRPGDAADRHPAQRPRPGR